MADDSLACSIREIPLRICAQEREMDEDNFIKAVKKVSTKILLYFVNNLINFLYSLRAWLASISYVEIVKNCLNQLLR